MRKIIGVSAFYHDSAAALIIEGKICNAVQEERFTRIKHDSSFPINSIKFLLKNNKITLNEIDAIVFYEKPFLKFERILENYFEFAPYGFKSFNFSMPIWIKEKLFQKTLLISNLKKINKKFNKNKLFFSEHHLSHAASAFYPSPFDEAIILTLDGVGEWATSTISYGKENRIKILEEIHYPHSLGLLYSAFTFYLGFKVNSGEYKLMGLAPYGKPLYANIIRDKILDIKEDGSFRLNMKYFNYPIGLKMINSNFEKLFDLPARISEDQPLSEKYMNIAASIQCVLEEIILKMIKYISVKYKLKNLCLSGGVALNCVANSKIYQSKYFENIWVQPASGDSGCSLGAALCLWFNELNNKRKTNFCDSMNNALLGPIYSQSSIENILNEIGAKFKIVDDENLIHETTNYLCDGKAIGWFQGAMEFGPRSLGSRSIIADPRSPTMQKTLNLKIKYRESFRPFAPSVLRDKVSDWFDDDIDSPYMLMTSQVKKNKLLKPHDNLELKGLDKLNIQRSKIPAVTHVDNSARIQTVDDKSNKKYLKLLRYFYKKTDCPVLINTSFNIRGEPIVQSPHDAFQCFMGTELDVLVIGNCILNKEEQEKALIKDYRKKFKLD